MIVVTLDTVEWAGWSMQLEWCSTEYFALLVSGGAVAFVSAGPRTPLPPAGALVQWVPNDEGVSLAKRLMDRYSGCRWVSCAGLPAVEAEADQ